MRDGAVLPILNSTATMINNPTLLARMSREELEWLLYGYGWTPFFVEARSPRSMHQAMAATTLDHCLDGIRAVQAEARATGVPSRPRWPMVVLRSPKGWTAPAEIDGHMIEGFWRAHQVPIADVPCESRAPRAPRAVAAQLPSEELFDEAGAPVPEVRAVAPAGRGAWARTPTPTADPQEGAVCPGLREVRGARRAPATSLARTRGRSGSFCATSCARTRGTSVSSDRTRPPRTGSDAVYEATRQALDGGFLPEGRRRRGARGGRPVVEMLCEHTLEGMLEGYLLTGRHGFFSTYEAFVHVIGSMFKQHAKWLDICNRLSWREEVASLNLLITSTVWRQEHNGFTHQDPGSSTWS